MGRGVSRRAVIVGGAIALSGAAFIGGRALLAQSVVAPVEGAPTLVMFHVEAGW